MSEMFVHVLIQTSITFDILKSYRDFWMFLTIKDYTLRLCRLYRGFTKNANFMLL